MAAKKKAAKKTTEAPKAAPKPGTLPGITKSQFIRDHSHLSPAETVEAAAKQGLTITPGFVHSVRYDQKKKAGQAPGKPGRKPKSLGATAASLPIVKLDHPDKGSLGSERLKATHEQAMWDAVRDLGIIAAQDLMQRAVDKLRRIP